MPSKKTSVQCSRHDLAKEALFTKMSFPNKYDNKKTADMTQVGNKNIISCWDYGQQLTVDFNPRGIDQLSKEDIYWRNHVPI